MALLQYLFGMRSRVSRGGYLASGISLLILKFLFEMGFYYLAFQKIMNPIQFLSPLIILRYPKFDYSPDWFLPVVLLYSLPFIWVGVGMSIRRAADAGLSPWLGVLFFIPGINYVFMGLLSLLPSSNKAIWEEKQEKIKESKFFSLLAISFIFAIFGTIIVWFNTDFLNVYLSSLFLASPLILGLIQGHWLHHRHAQSFKKTLFFVSMTIYMIHLLLLLFALEGIICLGMSLPIALILSLMGAALGFSISKYSRSRQILPMMMLVVLPIMPMVEQTQTYQDVVVSSVEINALVSQVWPNVVAFSELPQSNDWLFKIGIAQPLRARIDGEGVGAIRYCEFTTGAFVEPITVWNPPHHLGFNVKYQPKPMKEWSFYESINPPHLNGYFRSIRGEFKLISLSNGKTRLEGRTWYEMDMKPGWYWELYARLFIHRIHHRVLSHIKTLSEGPLNAEKKVVSR